MTVNCVDAKQYTIPYPPKKDFVGRYMDVITQYGTDELPTEFINQEINKNTERDQRDHSRDHKYYKTQFDTDDQPQDTTNCDDDLASKPTTENVCQTEYFDGYVYSFDAKHKLSEHSGKLKADLTTSQNDEIVARNAKCEVITTIKTSLATIDQDLKKLDTNADITIEHQFWPINVPTAQASSYLAARDNLNCVLDNIFDRYDQLVAKHGASYVESRYELMVFNEPGEKIAHLCGSPAQLNTECLNGQFLLGDLHFASIWEMRGVCQVD